MGIDPELNDPEGGDYSLAPGSPAAGYGCQTFGGDSGRSPGSRGPAPGIIVGDKRDEITVSGPITTDTVWNADKVNVVGDVIVENGVTLTIVPGVWVEYHDYYRLSIQGRDCTLPISYRNDSGLCLQPGRGLSRFFTCRDPSVELCFAIMPLSWYSACYLSGEKYST